MTILMGRSYHSQWGTLDERAFVILHTWQTLGVDRRGGDPIFASLQLFHTTP